MTTECSELERTHALADGELSPDEAAQHREHIASCAACQAELADLVQIELAVGEAPRRAAAPIIGAREPERAGRVINLAWYRRRVVQVAAVAVAAAASVAIYVAVARREAPVDAPRPVAVALASKRMTEARVAWGGARDHRVYGVPRAGEAPHEDVPLAALADLERAGDRHGVGVLALLGGDRAQAHKYLEQAGESADVLADRAALALADGAPERALVAAEAALARTPGHAVAIWNRALALRELGLTAAAADAFRAVAALGEPGWAAEATARATALDAETAAQRDLTNRVFGASTKLPADPAALDPADAGKLPGLARAYLYDALLASPQRDYSKLVDAIDAAAGGHDVRAFADRAAAHGRAHPELAATYTEVAVARQTLAAPARARYLDALRAAHADDQLILSLIHTAPDRRNPLPGEVPELARLAAASPDPWLRLLGAEKQAAAALAADDLPGAEALALAARAGCGASAPSYRCTKLDLVLADIYLVWQRIDDARGVLATGWARARRDHEWYLQLDVLARLVRVGMLGDDAAGSGLPLVRAYTDEIRLRWTDPARPGLGCRWTQWARVMTSLVLIDQIRTGDAARELAAAPAHCDADPLEPASVLVQLHVRAHVVRESGDPAQLAALRADVAALRAAPGTSPTVKALLDHAEGRALIDRDPATAEPLLRRAIAAAKSAPPADADARKVVGWSYSVLAIAAAERNDGAGAVSILAEEQGVTPPARCLLGLAVDDQRRIAVARDATGAVHVHHDADRRSGVPGVIVPADFVAALASCSVVDVIARPPVHGTARLLPDAIAWRYLGSRELPLGATGQRELVVSDVEPPAALGLPRLASWGTSGGDRLTGAAATPARVLAAIADAGVVTIHAHGLVDLARPDASFLALSPDAQGRYALTAGEVRKARLRGRPLVILAACRASQAAPVLHEPWSLPAAFVHAGARAVIASAAPIPDAEAAAFFDDLRARVAAGASVAVALRDARVQWIERGRGEWVRDVIAFE